MTECAGDEHLLGDRLGDEVGREAGRLVGVDAGRQDRGLDRVDRDDRGAEAGADDLARSWTCPRQEARAITMSMGDTQVTELAFDGCSP